MRPDKEALLYEKLEDSEGACALMVRCAMCAHRCIIADGRRGLCAVRQNTGGVLVSLVYGLPCSMNNDPVEKKPLYHFLPGTTTLSIATVGCNFKCLHCQNSPISQYPREHGGQIAGGIDAGGRTPPYITHDQIVAVALREGSRSISYTYTEPTIYMEYALDCARLAHEKGLKNIFVSNGFMTPESADLIIPFLDADNVDLKGDEKFYKDICGAKAAPVMDTIRRLKDNGVWVEVTTLVIPGRNDSDETLAAIAGFIADVDKAMPWHVSAFYPTYKMPDAPRTPVETLRRARRIGIDAGLKFVYEGNAPEEGGGNTCCPVCGEVLVERHGFYVRRNVMRVVDGMSVEGEVSRRNGVSRENGVRQGRCVKCGAGIEGVWG